MCQGECEYVDMAEAYHLGELSKEDEAAFLRHLKECKSCQVQLCGLEDPFDELLSDENEPHGMII